MLTYEIISTIQDDKKPIEVKYIFLDGEITTEFEYIDGLKNPPEEVTRYRATSKVQEVKDYLAKDPTEKNIKDFCSTKLEEEKLKIKP